MGNETGTRDSAKEELGWLKVVFAVAAAIDASLVAWLGQHHGDAERPPAGSRIPGGRRTNCIRCQVKSRRVS